MARRPWTLGLGVALALAAGSAQAISMTPGHEYTNWWSPGSAADSVGFLNWTDAGGSAFTGTGTLLNTGTGGTYHFLTAAHNVDHDHNGVLDASSFTVYFGRNTGADGSTATGTVQIAASGVSVQPLWQTGNASLGLTGGAAQYDMAVLSFSSASLLSGVLPGGALLGTSASVGDQVRMAGYGAWGYGNSFANNAADGTLRVGVNILDSVGVLASAPANTGYTLQLDFDGPGGAGNNMGGIALYREAGTAGGDSGGPLMNYYTGAVLGVLNGGYPGTGGNLSEYGDVSVYASVLETDNAAFLSRTLVSAVPEPGTWALMLSGVLGLGFIGRRRRG